MSKLKAAFDDPDAGWVMLTIIYNGETLGIVASHIYDCFSHLTYALHKLLDEQGESTVTLLAEPVEYDLQFTRVDDNVGLMVKEFPGHQRNPSEAKLLLYVAGTYDEVCLPFWRALRSLQGRFSEEEIRARWREPFPTQQLNALTGVIKQ